MNDSYQLTTDVLERQFGPLKLTVLAQSALNRVTQISALRTNQSLEFALVAFTQQTADQFKAVHQAITEGSMIGKTFRNHGIAFNRQPIAHFALQNELLATLFEGRSSAVVKVADLLVGENREVYARNIEFYSPLISWNEPNFAEHSFESAANEALIRIHEILHSSKGISV
jgi:DNA-binding FadR family transcriptional regulator